MAMASTLWMRMDGSPGPGAVGADSPAFPGGPMMRPAGRRGKPMTAIDGRRAIDAGARQSPSARPWPAVVEGGAGPADFSLEERGPGDYNAWQERMPTFDLDAYVARSGAVDLDAIAWDEVPRHPLPPAGGAHHALHAGHREPHDRLPALAPGHPRRRRSRGGHVPRLLAPRGDVPRHRPAPLPRGGRPSDAAARAAAGPGALGQAARGGGDGHRVQGLARFLRRAHDVGRDQRADDADRLSAPGRRRRSPGAVGLARSHRASTSRGTSSSTTARPRSASGGRRWPG